MLKKCKQFNFGYLTWVQMNPFPVTLSANGHHAFNAEHTWADGAVMMHLAEEISVLEHLLIEYCPKTGRILGDKETKLPIFRALTFTDFP